MAGAQKVVVVIVGKDEMSGVAEKVKHALGQMDEQGRRNNETMSRSVMLGDLYSRALTNIWQHAKGVGERAFKSASQFEQFQISLTVLTKSAEKANEVLADLNKFSLITPFTPTEVMAAGRSLVAYGFQLQDIQKWLRVAGDAASTFADKINLEQVVSVLGRLKSGDFGESFERLRDIGISRELLEGAGLKFDRSGAFQGSVKEALDAVEKIITERYGGMMEEQSKTWQGLASTAEGYFDEALRKIMDSGTFDFLKGKLEEIIAGINAAIESGEFNKWARDIGKSIEAFVTKLWDVTKWLYENRETLMELARVIGIVFAINKIDAWGNKLLGNMAKIELSAKGLSSSTGMIKEGFKNALKSPIVWAAATEAAIWGINKAFDALNAKIDENLQKTEDMVSVETKQEAAVKAIQSSMSKTDWAKLISADELNIVGKLASEKFQALQAWARANAAEDERAAKALKAINDLIEKNKKKIEERTKSTKTSIETNTALTKTVEKIEDTYSKLLDQFSQYDLKTLNQQWTDLNKLQAAVNDGAIHLSNTGLEQLKKKIMEVGSELGKLNDEQFAEFSKSLLDHQDLMGHTQVSGSDLENSIVSEGPTLFDELIDGAVSVATEISKWTPGIYNALDALGLMTDDMAALLTGVEGIAGGIGKIAAGDMTGILDVIAGIPSLLDGLFESFEEGFTDMWSKWGFDEQLSENLISKIEKVSDAKGDISYGIGAYIEEIFSEIDISNQEEMQRMSDALNDQIGVYLAQGHTVEEAYEKYGDELEQLVDSQEKYGLESTAALDQMLKLQREQTSAGHVAGITDAISGIDKMIEGMSAAGYSEGSFNSVFGLLQNTFQKLQAEGLSMQEIFEKMSPTIEKAKEAAEKAGISTDSMQALVSYYDKMKDAGPILDVISGLETAMQGLSSTGTLTQQNLNDMTVAANESIQKLKDAGFSDTQILEFMGPTISQMVEAAEKFGYDLPQNIKDLGAQVEKMDFGKEKSPAEEIADWGEKQLAQNKEWGDGMIKALEDMAHYAEGGVVPGTGSTAQLAWLHPGETVIPPGAIPYLPFLAGTQQQAQQQPLELKIVLDQKSGSQAWLENLIGVTVEKKTKNGEVKIPFGAIEQ